MARHMNMSAIMGALRSSKTPAGLKKGLLKKYGHMFGKEKIPMEALATTVKANPKKENKMAYGTSFYGQAKRIKAKVKKKEKQILKSWYIIHSKTLRIVSGTEKEIQEIFDDDYAPGVTGPFVSKASAQSYARKES